MPGLPPKPKRERFKSQDFAQVKRALDQQELWPYPLEQGEASIWGEARAAVEARYSERSGRQLSMVPASSGTAAIHVALGGLQIPAGTEVIVPPITDMGTIMPVIFQNCIPVFADVDLATGIITRDTIESVATKRTSAVIVVHLTGSPADMDEIMKFCRQHKIKVIEDAAQALGATYKGKPAGTLSDAGAFSLNSWKHITSGEGGFVLVEGSEKGDLFLRHLNFADKHRNRMRSNVPEHSTYAGSGLNYRMNDLELSLLVSQLEQLDAVASKYTLLGRRLDERLCEIPGLVPQAHHADATPVYFFCFFRVDADRKTRDALHNIVEPAAKAMGIFLDKAYGEPLNSAPVFQRKNFFDTSVLDDNGQPLWPAELVAQRTFNDPSYRVDYSETATPNARRWSDTGFALYINNNLELEHIDAFADCLEKAVKSLM